MTVFDRATVANLNHKINAMQSETVLLREELAAANTNLQQQQHENSALRTENSALLDGHRRQMQVSLCLLLLKARGAVVADVCMWSIHCPSMAISRKLSKIDAQLL